MDKFSVGDIVRHSFRKSGLYLVCGIEDSELRLCRVKNQTGYPVSGSKSIYREGIMTRLSKVTHVAAYDNLKIWDVAKLQNAAATQNFNARRAGFNSYSAMTEKVKQEFVNIFSALSPENLTCDGELSRGRIAQKRAELNRKYNFLCREYNVRPTESEVWAEFDHRRAEEVGSEAWAENRRNENVG